MIQNLGLGEGSALPVGVPVPWPSATPPAGRLNATEQRSRLLNIRNLRLLILPSNCQTFALSLSARAYCVIKGTMPRSCLRGPFNSP
nr:MAG TPA: hypothetical protein [Caudoviricetes sp.]